MVFLWICPRPSLFILSKGIGAKVHYCCFDRLRRGFQPLPYVVYSTCGVDIWVVGCIRLSTPPPLCVLVFSSKGYSSSTWSFGLADGSHESSMPWEHIPATPVPRLGLWGEISVVGYIRLIYPTGGGCIKNPTGGVFSRTVFRSRDHSARHGSPCCVFFYPAPASKKNRD